MAKKTPAKKPVRAHPGRVADKPMRLAASPENFEHLADVKLWSLKNSLDGAVPIYANVNVGPISIDANGKHYRMFVRWAMLRLRYEGFDISAQEKRYNRLLGAKEAKAHVERVHREESNSGWKGKVAAKFGFKKVSASAEAGTGRANSERESEKIDANIQLALVQNLPNGAWRIGDQELGDIRKLQGFLEGDYLYHDCPQKEPLCLLESRKNATKRSVSASLSISVRNGAHVVRDGAYASDRSIPDDERDTTFAEAFKDRLRSLALAKGMDAADQLVIARHQLVAEPIEDDI